ncbi:MAG: hybrid sensor histidine kinase/response regulator [Myxococcota bacterium]
MANDEAEVAALRARVGVLEQRVAELERTEQALAETEERFRVAFMTAPFAVTIASADDGRYLWVNPGFCQLSGWTEAEAVGRTLVELGIFADEQELVRIHTAVVTKGVVENDVFHFGRKDGTRGVGLLSSRPISLRGRRCQLGVLHDITELRRTADERDRLQEQLRQAQKMESIGRLAGGVAHDFNNILTAITTNVSLSVMELPPGDPSRESFEEIGQAAWRAAQLTRQLLAFSRKQVIEPRAVDLAGAVGSMESMLRRLLPESIQLVCAARGARPAFVDPGQLEQIIVNLVVNARDAIDGAGTISLCTRPATSDELARAPGCASVLTVTDTGRGMSPEVQAQIFEPFFTTKNDRGTGMGLSTVEGIVTQHGGAIVVESAPGAGATFSVYLPEAKGPVDVAPKPAPRRGPRRSGVVLLVEDEATLRGPVQQLLERMGYAVLVAANGAEALEQVRTFPRRVDLLLTDVVLPGLGGRELAERLAPLQPEMVVLYMSGYTLDVIDRSGVLDPGVVLLRKPFDAAQLSDAIDAALSARAGIANTA